MRNSDDSQALMTGREVAERELTRLPPVLYARMCQWQSELVQIALAELGVDEHPTSDLELAFWAADELVPGDLFWTCPEGHILHVLRGAYRAAAGPPIPPTDMSSEERYEMLKFELERRHAEREHADNVASAMSGDLDALESLRSEE